MKSEGERDPLLIASTRAAVERAIRLSKRQRITWETSETEKFQRWGDDSSIDAADTADTDKEARKRVAAACR